MGEVARELRERAGVGPYAARVWARDYGILVLLLLLQHVPSLAEREKVDGAMVALRFRDQRARRMRVGRRTPRGLSARHKAETRAIPRTIWLRFVILDETFRPWRSPSQPYPQGKNSQPGNRLDEI